MVESEPELISTGIAFDVQLVAQVFQADYVVKHGGLCETLLEEVKSDCCMK
jgi:hypothetical protein